MTDAEIDKAVAERVCGGTLGEEYGDGGGHTSGMFMGAEFFEQWSPSTNWQHAMMAAEAWCKANKDRRFVIHGGTRRRYQADCFSVATSDEYAHAENESGPRALCEALLAAVEAEQKL